MVEEGGNQGDMALMQVGGDGLSVGLSGPIWDRVYKHMVIVFEKKGKGVLGLLFLCSVPEGSVKLR